VVFLAAIADGPGFRSADVVLRKIDGTSDRYRGVMTIPKWVGDGRWRISRVYVRDAAGNNVQFNYAGLGGAGFARSFSVRSRTDHAPPRMTDFTRTPSRLDVRTHDGKLHVTVKATDAGSGVASLRVVWSDPQEGGTAVGIGGSLHRVSGTAHSGTWKATLTVRRCHPATALIYGATVFINDRSGRISDRSPPSAVHLRYDDYSFADFAVSPPSTASDPVRVFFDEAVNGITRRSAVVRQGIDPRDATPDPLVPGSWTCTSISGTVTDCRTGEVRAADFTPVSGWTQDQSYYVMLNPEHSLGVTDLVGNAPRRWWSGFTVD
jgi:hypothetical protein